MNEDGTILRLLLARDEQAVVLAENRYGRLCRSAFPSAAERNA